MFFRRKVLKLLQHYWLRRWDDLELKKLLSLTYTPKYYCQHEVLDNFYIKLANIDYVWFKGVFSKGIHLKSGRYYHEPYHFSNKGMGPRELVFPIQILDKLDDLTLIADWTRYQLCEINSNSKGEMELLKLNYKAEKRTRISVSSIRFEFPKPLMGYWGREHPATKKTICLVGRFLNGPRKGREYLIPMREVFWKEVFQGAG